MKNKYLILPIVFLLSFASVSASDKVHVCAKSEFSTVNPSKSIDVTVLEDSVIGMNELKANDTLHCNVVKISNPKRGKRSASFAVCPISYTTDGVTKDISGAYYGKYAARTLSSQELKNIDAKKVGKKVAVSVGGHFVKGVAPAVALAEGMIKNEEGNRLESGVKQVYKSSPLSYIEKGSNLVLEPGKAFYLVFKPSSSKDIAEIAAEAEADEEMYQTSEE